MPTIRVVLSRNEESIQKNVLAHVVGNGALKLVHEDNNEILVAYYPPEVYSYFETVEAKVEGGGSNDSTQGLDWLLEDI